jgi:hypothetical protein
MTSTDTTSEGDDTNSSNNGDSPFQFDWFWISLVSLVSLRLLSRQRKNNGNPEI